MHDNLLVIKSPIHLELAGIPAGAFLMGSNKANDADAYDDELPQHTVTLDEFFIGKYPITVAQFAVFAQATNYKTTAEQQGSADTWNGKANQDHSVTRVSWDDALAFCTWLSQAAGRDIRLPTEAQWEKAARGPSTGQGSSSDGSGCGRIYPWGHEPPDDARCNFNMNVGHTTPVGNYSPAGDSPYGCADMAGNVWEWCADWLDEKEYARRSGEDVKDPIGPPNGTRRIVRGGDFADPQRDVRCAARGRFNADYHGDRVGFRVCALPIHL